MDNIDKYVVCPYYRSNEQRKILCEGIQDKAYIHLVFSNWLDKRPYMQNYCCSMDNYNNCRIADMLNLKHLMEG